MSDPKRPPSPNRWLDEEWAAAREAAGEPDDAPPFNICEKCTAPTCDH